MCGIAGSVCWENIQDEEFYNITKVTTALNHRGPDFRSIKSFGKAHIGHSRLSIIDLNKNANQPMIDSTKRYAISYNGEIYNYNEIKKKLIYKGVVFKTKSDTEVILESFKCWGEKCLDIFEGMFVFAIWDRTLESLFLARDRLGEKPLFLAPFDSKKNFDSGLIFSSELRALLLHPRVRNSINNEAIWQYLSLNYILTNTCIIENIVKLEPASYAIFSRNSKIIKRYWELKNFFSNKRKFISKANAIEEFNELLKNTVKKQTNSDVPLGAFLSGGVDSSIISANVKGVNKDKKFQTFCIGFDEDNYNEIPQSKYISKFLDFENRSRVINADIKNDFLEILDKVCDEPLADTSIIPMFYLCKFAKEHVTVTLSGDGADEVFMGYDTYVADKLKISLNFVPLRLKKFFLDCSKLLIPVSHNKVSFDYKLKQFLSGSMLSDNKAHYWWRNIFPDRLKKEIFLDGFCENLSDPYETYSLFFDDVSDCNFFDQVSYVDIKTWLVDSILMKVDKASMAHSLECRSPFLSHKIVEFAASLPANWKLLNLNKKSFLKKSQKHLLPKNVFNKKKLGFNSPISYWLNDKLNKLGKEVTLDSKLKDLIKKKSIEKLWFEHEQKKFDHGYRLFGLICLGRWLERNK